MKKIISDITTNIGFIGFGEAGAAIANGFSQIVSISMSAYDIKIEQPYQSNEIQQRIEASKVNCHREASELCQNSDVLFSLVTADQALIAAKQISKSIKPGNLYLDCNSCAPETKRQAELLITNAGGRYVDVAIMAPIYPELHQTSMLVCGPHATSACEIMDNLNMRPTLIDGKTGDAASTKMIRSIMIKGMEALMAECMLAGRKAGVEKRVMQSLTNSYPAFDWRDKSNYMMERMALHGRRRAAEMREVVKTVDQLGLDSDMSKAIVSWQQKLGDLDIKVNYDDRNNDKKFPEIFDLVLGRLEKNSSKQGD